MQKTCAHCQSPFEVSGDDLAFYEKISPAFNGKKYLIPAPNLCPDCRLQRRLAFRNDRNLYVRTCDFSGKKLISMYAPDLDLKVYDSAIWRSDQWDRKAYGRDFDFSRSFFAQFEDLIKAVPVAHIQNISSENALYTNYSYQNKNSYLCSASIAVEDCQYCYQIMNLRACLDCLFTFDTELSYECVNCEHCYQAKFLLNSKNCSDSAFLEDCHNCRNCFMCWNLRNKEYCYLNRQLTKEEYEELMRKKAFSSHLGLMNLMHEWQTNRRQFIKPENHNLAAENCSGDYILHSKNCCDSYFLAQDTENCRYTHNSYENLKDSFDCTNSGIKCDHLIECLACGNNCHYLAFSNRCYFGSENLLYCFMTEWSKNCFGCIGLNKAEYCILNKQYTKEAYNQLVPQIIEQMQKMGEWGEFFPIRSSSFRYNETMAQDFFPLQKEAVLRMGGQWLEKAPQDYLKTDFSIPDEIADVAESIVNQVLACEHCQKNYRINAEELNYYQKQKIAVPHFCPDCRHQRRLSLLNPRKLWLRNCAKCKKKMQVTYAPERPEIVYCEECYLKEVY